MRVKAEIFPIADADPVPPDWGALELAPTWADGLKLSTPRGLWRFLRALKGRRQPVQLEPGQPLCAGIPRYALQEFHNLPNGNYSRKIAHGYITGFDIVMLGQMQRVRRQLAARVAGLKSVLDLGTGGGKLAQAVREAGVTDVWGVDVSPYMLKHAATNHPRVRFFQAPAEQLPFTAGRFDALVVCFLFHEMPPKYIARALREAYRVLKPGGQLLVAEPSAAQLEPVAPASLLTCRGWKHLYFQCLARRVYEPFLGAWHRLDKPATFTAAGFVVKEQSDRLPVNFYALEKPVSNHER